MTDEKQKKWVLTFENSTTKDEITREWLQKYKHFVASFVAITFAGESCPYGNPILKLVGGEGGVLILSSRFLSNPKSIAWILDEMEAEADK